MTARMPCAALILMVLLSVTGCSPKPDVSVPGKSSVTTWDPFLDTLQEKTLRWFLAVTPEYTGLTPDRWPSPAPASIAAVGFGLTTYPIAVERGILNRTAATSRVLQTLRFLRSLPQGPHEKNIAGHQGFFYHFLKTENGLRAWNCELSTIDTGLLMAGVLFCQSYFSLPSSEEDSIRAIADALYRRVDWKWFTGDRKGIFTGWYPERGFTEYTWKGYNEALILYVLALGSPTFPVPDWYVFDWYSEYRWGSYAGIEHLKFGPLFGHQYSHCWIDFRGIKDRYMWGRGIDYFENSRRATYAQRAYGAANPKGYPDYSDVIWGWTACDGPKDTLMRVDGKLRQFWTYRAREVTFDWVEDDGTIAPTAAGGSIAFAPEICLPALKAMRERYSSRIWKEYGFVDAFNTSYRAPETGDELWAAADYLGIDQGPIAIMIENLRSGLVWATMKKNPYVVRGLRRMGFSGGWLDDSQSAL